MHIDILHVAHCPHLEDARAHVREAVASTGVRATVEELEITTSDDARRLGMHGSPTILLDGRDPFATDAEDGSFSCRLYTVDGRLAGSPSVPQIVAAIASVTSSATPPDTLQA